MILRTDTNYEIGGTSVYANGQTPHAQNSQHDESVSFKKILEDAFEKSGDQPQASATYTRAQAGGNVPRTQTDDAVWQTIFDNKEEDDNIANLNNGRTDVADNEESSEEEEVAEDDEVKLKKLYYISQNGDRMLRISTESGEVIKRINLGPAMNTNEASGLTDLSDSQILSQVANMTLTSHLM